MELRSPRLADARALGEVHVRSWQAAYAGLMPADYLANLSVDHRAAAWERALCAEPRPRVARFVADEGGEVVGFIVAGPAEGDADAVEGEVYALNVDPDDWGRGVGQALLHAGTTHLAAAGFATAILWVHPGNDRARRFYEAAGWQAEDAERRQEVWGVVVPEVRYRRSLVRAG